ncbi:MAG: hypothetical protein ACJ77K_00795 [Bacteroidia bacterium]
MKQPLAYENLERFLAVFFFDESNYKRAIEKLKLQLSPASEYQKAKQLWPDFKELVVARKIDGWVLKLVHNGANRVLDENTSDEAYIWLDLVIKNVENRWNY